MKCKSLFQFHPHPLPGKIVFEDELHHRWGSSKGQQVQGAGRATERRLPAGPEGVIFQTRRNGVRRSKTSFWLFLPNNGTFLASKPRNSSPDLVRSETDFVRSKADFVISVTNFVKSLTGFVRKIMDLARSDTDFVKSKTDFARSVTDFARSKADLVNSLTGFVNWQADLVNKRCEFHASGTGQRIILSRRV